MNEPRPERSECGVLAALHALRQYDYEIGDGHRILLPALRRKEQPFTIPILIVASSGMAHEYPADGSPFQLNGTCHWDEKEIEGISLVLVTGRVRKGSSLSRVACDGSVCARAE